MSDNILIKMICASNCDNFLINRYVKSWPEAVNFSDDDGMTPLQKAIEKENLVAVNILLKKGANPNTKDIMDQTPLHTAVTTENLELVEFLIDHNASVNAVSINGRTPMHFLALQRENYAILEIARLLLDHGADIEIRDELGFTAGDLARRNGNVEMERVLRDELF